MLRTLYAIALTTTILIGGYSFALSATEQAQVQELIETPLQHYIDKLLMQYDPTAELRQVLQKLDEQLTAEDLSDTTRYGLDFARTEIDIALQSILQLPSSSDNTHSGRTTETGTLLPISSYFPGDKTILAGEESLPVIKLEYTAQLEDIVIEELAISAPNDISTLIQYLRVYDASGSLLGTVAPVGDTLYIDQIPLYINQGPTTFYITLTPYPVGQYQLGSQGSNIKLSFEVQKAVGQMSHREIPHFGGTYISDQITIVPVRIQDIAFHATAFGHRVYDTLYPGSNNLAILSITADTRDNKNSTSSRDLGLLLNALTVTVHDGTLDGHVRNRLTIQRLDSGDKTPFAGNDAGNGKTRFNFSGAPLTTRQLDSGETAYFLIRGDIILQENLAEYVGISLDDLDDGSVVYSSDDSNAQLIDVLNFPSDYLENTLLYD